MADPVCPSGAQIELAYGQQRAIVVELGAALRVYEHAGRALLDGYEADEMCSAGRGQTLIPWPNRIAEGRYAFAGRTHQLSLSEPGRETAIHGLVRWTSWRVEVHEPHRAVLTHVLYPQPGYPFALDLQLDYSLGDDGLRVRTTATNVGAEPCPYGAGAHPYLTAGTETIDPVLLHAPGTVRLLTDPRGIPVGREPVTDTEYDFTTPRRIGQTQLDTCYTGLVRGGDGMARVELRAPDGDTAALWLDESYPYLMLFSGDPLPELNRRSLGVEPMTCAPNAFRSGDGLRTLEPGESFASVWGISYR